ncbi:Multifunctional CCA protein [Candidatus Providencia siddallii]|uniref:CCA-adding enzyme n=1 Tax=Candidatus Providencia siddallii TaxID=1715285 RepID=A0A0M6W9L1_9GAMM|nr:Multifunctional CCA protein [Candidatus Providencia siddallii]
MKIYLVGGAVRDQLLGLPVSDRDFVVVGSTPEKMLAKGFRQVGNDFPVFIHPKTHDEYSLARTERKTGLGYTGFSCYSSPDVTIEEDLLRRDLTINAIAKDEAGKLIDPYHGFFDINNRILRHVSSAFIEDSLRILRVARFAARFYKKGFTIAPETMLLMQFMSNSNELSYLSSERIWLETKKALKSDYPEIFLNVLRKCGALAVLFPEVNNLFGIPSIEKMNSEIDTGIHTLTVMQVVSRLTNDINVRFAALCHDFGKVLTPKEELPNHPKHGENGVFIIKKFCKRIKTPKNICNFACIVSRFHDVIHTINMLTSSEIINFFGKLDAWRKLWRVEQLSIISEADACDGYDNIIKIYPQGEYLRQAFNAAQTVNVKKIVNYGFRGSKINEELNKQRVKSVEKWKNYQKIM